MNAIDIGVGKTVKAATGVEKAFDAYLVTGIAGAESLVGYHAKITGATALAVTGYAYGVYVELEVLGTGQLGSGGNDVNGIRVELYQEASATIGEHVMSIMVTNYMLGTITGSYFMMYLAENGDVTLQAWMHFLQGGTSDANYFISVAGVSSAWSPAGDKTGSSTGWLKVLTPGGPRYIQLYT